MPYNYQVIDDPVREKRPSKEKLMEHAEALKGVEGLYMSDLIRLHVPEKKFREWIRIFEEDSHAV